MASQERPILDIAHPRKSDRAVALAFRKWLDDLDDTELVDLPVCASDELAAARAERDV